jgi:hypothetical protein
MKCKTKKLGVLLMTAALLLPGLIYGNELSLLKEIKVTPKKLEMPQGATEKEIRQNIVVSAYYKGQKNPEVIQNYTMDYEKVKDKVGRHTLRISYTQCDKTKETKLCLIICEGNGQQPSTPAPTSIPTPTPMPTTPQESVYLPYVGGYEDGTFRPNQAVTREELASMIARLIAKGQVPKETNTYTDLNPSRYSTDNINYVTRLGIFTPYPDGTFRAMNPVSTKEFNEILLMLDDYTDVALPKVPEEDRKVTRAEAVVTLNRLFKRRCDGVSATNPYTDLDSDYWAYNDILCASVRQNVPAESQ